MIGHVENEKSATFQNWYTNCPPEKPIIPYGRKFGRLGVNFTYETSASDSDDDILYYLFNWGDGSDSGWFGPYKSGEPVETVHHWKQKGTYEIKVKAMDMYGAESDWSDPLEVSMPRNKAINPFILFLERLIDRFPILEQILQPIYGELTGF